MRIKLRKKVCSKCSDRSQLDTELQIFQELVRLAPEQKRRASSELDDLIQDENSPRNEKLIDTKFQSSLFGRLPPFSVCHTSVPLCSTVIPLVGRPDAIADYGSNRWMSGIDLSEWFLVTIFLILLFFFFFLDEF